jgi:indole-3-glycerol phosphate synthase
MAPMMVVGDSWELDSAMAAEPDVICIENRGLEGGSGDVARTERLAQHVPCDILVVSAHGIVSREDAERAAAAGADAVLFDPPADYELARDAVRDLRGIAAAQRGAQQ